MKAVLLIATPLLIGIVSGVLAALCGVGGGIIMVPAFVMFLGLGHKVAVATSMAVIVPTALAAVSQHIKNELVDWRVFALTAVAASVTSFIAADYVKTLKNDTLTRLFATVVILVGVKMLVWPESQPAAKPTPAIEQTSAEKPGEVPHDSANAP